MKSIKFFALCAVALLSAACCSMPKVAPQPEGITKGDVDTASYALGVYYGQMILMNNLGDLNASQIIKGFKDALKDAESETPKFDQNFVGEAMNNFMAKKSELEAAQNLKKGEEFLAKNATADGVQVTDTGIQYLVVREGNGVFPTNDKDTVLVCYEGSTLDGKVFDSSYEREDTVSFPLNRVIKGWTEGMKHADEGSEIILWIPSELAYGQRGPMGPNQTLKFKVELIDVKPFVEPAADAE